MKHLHKIRFTRTFKIVRGRCSSSCFLTSSGFACAMNCNDCRSYLLGFGSFPQPACHTISSSFKLQASAMDPKSQPLPKRRDGTVSLNAVIDVVNVTKGFDDQPSRLPNSDWPVRNITAAKRRLMGICMGFTKTVFLVMPTPGSRNPRRRNYAILRLSTNYFITVVEIGRVQSKR